MAKYAWFSLDGASEIACCWYNSATKWLVCYGCGEQGYRWLRSKRRAKLSSQPVYLPSPRPFKKPPSLLHTYPDILDQESVPVAPTSLSKSASSCAAHLALPLLFSEARNLSSKLKILTVAIQSTAKPSGKYKPTTIKCSMLLPFRNALLIDLNKFAYREHWSWERLLLWHQPREWCCCCS